MIELRAHPFFDHLHTVFGVLYEGLPVLGLSKDTARR